LLSYNNLYKDTTYYLAITAGSQSQLLCVPVCLCFDIEWTLYRSKSLQILAVAKRNIPESTSSQENRREPLQNSGSRNPISNTTKRQQYKSYNKINSNKIVMLL
jgi:hypothetical protein